MTDLLLRNARLMDGSTVDLAVTDGHISALGPELPSAAPVELDAANRLVLPAFVNGQLHACKSFWRSTLERLSPAARSLPRFEAAHAVKRTYSAEDVFARVERAMRLALQHGTCAIRLFADVDADAGLSAVEGLLRIRARYAPLLHVQVVAFPQDGFAAPQTLSLMRRALELGADVMGGIPWIEQGDAQRDHVAACFALAREFDRDLHFVCDDVLDPNVRSLEEVAAQTMANGWQGRVSATQCAALAAYPDEYAAQVIDKVAAAGLTIFANSHVALIATDFAPHQPWPRGLTRVPELLARGVPVACGQDDIDNWFYPLGRNDMLEVAQFMAHMGRFAWDGAVNQVLPMVTRVPAHVLGLQRYGLHVGAAANLVVLEAADWHAAIQFQPIKRWVILRGRVAASTQQTVTIALP